MPFSVGTEAIRSIEGCLAMRGVEYKRTPMGRSCAASDTLLIRRGDADLELRCEPMPRPGPWPSSLGGGCTAAVRRA